MECLLPADGSFLCPNCEMPLCGVDCVNGPHHQAECTIFQNMPSGFKMRVKFDRPMYVYVKNYSLLSKNIKNTLFMLSYKDINLTNALLLKERKTLKQKTPQNLTEFFLSPF